MKKTIFACFGISLAAWLLVFQRSAGSSVWRWATGKRIAGRVDQVKGVGKETVGKLTGNTPLRAAGVLDEALGTVKHGLGKAVAETHEAITS